MIIACAVVAVLLQILVAPYISIFNATPNFVVAYVVCVAVVRQSSNRVVWLAFLLGLFYDLFVGGALGATSFLLVLLSFLLGGAQRILDNDTLFIPITLTVISIFLFEILYAILLSIAQVVDSVGSALIYVALPCALYSIVVSLIWYFVISRLASEPSTAIPSIDDTMIMR